MMPPDLHCDHLHWSGAGWTACRRRSATCTRGPAGQIVSYSRYAKRQEQSN